ncbi:MAG: hypothetical protein D6680_06085 [Cyanobacteria bacterium J007]|nr:MAG: hypothetical protein D6680_06085 [Cyanobacteria bacterium J007]
MAQASSQWRQLSEFVRTIPLSALDKPTLDRFWRTRLRNNPSLMLALFVATLLLACNWKLAVAIAIGTGAMLGVYALQSSHWPGFETKLRQFLHGTNRDLAIAVGSGGVATFGSYLAVSIWVESDNPWLATGAIVQGLCTMATLGLLSWHFLDRQTGSGRDRFHALLDDLTDTDPLKRLIAVRQLTRMMNASTTEDRQAIADCFRLLLARETEPIVRNAVLDGLKPTQDGRPHQLGVGRDPLSIPVSAPRTTQNVRRRVYEGDRD